MLEIEKIILNYNKQEVDIIIHLYPITRQGIFKLVQLITGNGELSGSVV